MYDPRNYPLAVLVLSLATFLLSVKAGTVVQHLQQNMVEDDHKDLNTVEAATLTLLGLIIAFLFSMAVNRYDQRKNLEAEEANAIGTEYARASLLAADKENKLRGGLRGYLRLRVMFYETRDFRQTELKRIETDTAAVENEMWSIVREGTRETPGPAALLVIGGLNDVLNSRGYTQAAWWNRIPSAAWFLLIFIAAFCNFLVGYGTYRTRTLVLLVLPLVVSVALFLIADIDSPHGGMIHIRPQNLVYLSDSLNRQ